MANSRSEKARISQNEKSTAGYRGRLVYQQEYGYKLITMTISLHTPDERSIVTTRGYDLTITEEAEHIPSGPPFTTLDQGFSVYSKYIFFIWIEVPFKLIAHGQ